MITTQILQEIEKSQQRLNNQGFFARLRSKTVMLELEKIRFFVLSLKKWEKLQEDQPADAENEEKDLMRDSALEEVNIAMTCIREVQKYYETSKDQEIPSYVARLFRQCVQDLDQQHLKYSMARIDLYKKKLDNLKKRIDGA